MPGARVRARQTTSASAVAMVTADPGAAYLAGGTTQLDLMLKDRVIEPERLVDIGRLPLRGTTRRDDTLRVGALTTMEELAADPTVRERLPLVRQALLAGASPQLRNMATIGGNLLQRTPLPLLPRPGRGGVQQAHTGFGVRGDHRPGPDARDPRYQRALHRPARFRPGRGPGRAGRAGAHPGRRAVGAPSR